MNRQMILYGAGKTGELYYNLLERQDMKDCIYAFCDKNANNIIKKFDKSVISYEDAKRTGLPFVIAVLKKGKNDYYQQIKEKLNKDKVKFYEDLTSYIREYDSANFDMVKYDRDYCELYHGDIMNKYFEEAEEMEALQIFWGEESVFLNMFQQLDLRNVVELACGRGRHVPKYMHKAENVTLVDIMDKNIECVRERFRAFSNIHYYKNNGYDLSELESDSYSSLFTYDAMVHFELLDIFNYLKETYRILTPGGMALFHHSNDSSDYKNSFANCTNPNGRNFMDKKLFAYLAYRAGFEIVEQRVIDWGTPNIDCISLVKK